ncbi:MAG TPA: SRPBCC family protein [Myxococcota bacterium]|nr:SRPBCC family protein [Myxococcota bacterium]
MEKRSANHASFSIERAYAASPGRVFAAWAQVEAKLQWFSGTGEWKELEREFDFRVGGRERLVGKWPDGMVTAFDGWYHDIVPDRRIVYTYDMRLDAKRISVSLATVELEPVGAGTRLRFTEQAAFLDGYDDSGSRERGTAGQLERLGALLER